jgi:hypothetical protein
MEKKTKYQTLVDALEEARWYTHYPHKHAFKEAYTITTPPTSSNNVTSL